jgi:hypothetical protein
MTARPAEHELAGAPTRRRRSGLVSEGDVFGLGDRACEAQHLPVTRPVSGPCGACSGAVLSGGVVYDRPLLVQVPGADIDADLRTIERLMALPGHSVTSSALVARRRDAHERDVFLVPGRWLGPSRGGSAGPFRHRRIGARRRGGHELGRLPARRAVAPPFRGDTAEPFRHRGNGGAFRWGRQAS